MSIEKSQKQLKKVLHERNDNLTGWDLAIREGEQQLKEWRSKVARLMAAIQDLKDAKEQGLPWQGGEDAGTD